MIFRILILTAFLPMICTASENKIRQGVPKQCYVACYGKGPSWFTEISFEIELAYCTKKQPIIDANVFDPSPKAVYWKSRSEEESWLAPLINEVARINGRKIVEITYRRKLHHIMDINMVLIETGVDSGWYSPFFIASVDCNESQPFTGCIISGKDIALGYLATRRFSGTGAFRSHMLFDLKKQHPQCIETVGTGRVRKQDFDSEEKYDKALKNLEREAKLYEGILN